MQTARVQNQPIPTPQPADDDELELSSDWIYRGPMPQSAGDRPASPASPALQLREHLAMRLGELSGAPQTATGGAIAIEQKWPMGWRVATIVGMSVALWGGIYLAVARAITG